MVKGEPWIRPALAIAIVSIIGAVLVQRYTGYPSTPGGTTRLRVALFVIAISALIRLLANIYRMWREGVDDPIARLRRGAPGAVREQLIMIAAILLVGAILASTTYVKVMIPAVQPFWADAPLARLDQFLGLNGAAIARALGPALPVVGLYYGLWHFANIGGILWIIHWRNHAKGRFIIAYMLTWLIGMTVAFLFSSAGPLFTGRYDFGLAPESVQKPALMLWANYQAKGALLGSGISAFPSLHVAVATWFALALRHRGWPKLGIAYVASIYFGSIVLGWHYGADGAGGILVALVSYKLAQRLTRAREPAPVALAPATA